MSEQYKVTIKHQGAETGNFFIYQTDYSQHEDIRSLAWFSKPAHPETELKFKWDIEYGFTWNEQGEVVPGVVFEAAQTVSMDPSNSDKNSLEFTKRNDHFQMKETNEFTAQENAEITCEELPFDQVASVGASMSDKDCGASPDMRYKSQPHPRYWVAFGKFKEGETIDLSSLTNRFEIQFDENNHDKTICLTESNNWQEESK